MSEPFKTSLPNSLLDAYRRTHYCVGDDASGFVLHVDAFSSALYALMHAKNLRNAAFITAWNPHGVPTPIAENRQSNAHLEALLHEQARLVLRGVGRAPSGSWSEESFLSLGLSKTAAIALATAFRQNAFLWASDDAIPRLILLR